MNNYRRKPNNELTNDLDEYLDSWNYVGEILSKKLNVKVIGFDPGFIVSDNSNVFGKSVEIPTWLALRIIDQIQLKENAEQNENER